MSNSDSKTDGSKLVTTETVYVSPDGRTTDEVFPKPNVEYDFCVDVPNAGFCRKLVVHKNQFIN